ncbi:DUF4397 domain-containing protein [Azohydromonas aeria]|uniref:DUF4397 domain-containing protein n=1 Tax=Azohydromonas aeria TaxID=2590212 RepID=UPI0012FBC5F5|nr:DUF4397 domain-containing protein [Azohydromonas aeria]
MQRRTIIKGSLALAAGWALAGCGGGDDDDATVRLLNLASSYGALDLYADDGETLSSVSADSVSADASLSADSHEFKLKRAGSGTASVTTTLTLASGTPYTLVAYATADALKTRLLQEDEDAPSSGTAKLRVVNLGTAAGTLDVYLTDTDTALSELAPNFSAVAGDGASAYNEISSGNYRLRVTGTGDATDLRLDIAALALGSGTVVTLLLTPGSGGVLVHGHALVQRGALTVARNTQARVRVVAGTPAGSAVSVEVAGTAVASGLRALAVGAYKLVDAGSMTPAVTVDGAAVSMSALTLAAGSDVTLAVLGEAGAATCRAITDDNRPSGTSTNARLRLLHGVVGLGTTLSLSADYGAVASEVAYGTASAPTGLVAGDDIRLEVTSSASSAALYLATDVTLAAGHVYTVFLLGPATSPTGVLRRDR